MSDEQRFAIPSDGRGACQVLVCDDDDLAYWKDQVSRRPDMEMTKRFHVEENAMGYAFPAHDVYLITPKKIAP